MDDNSNKNYAHCCGVMSRALAESSVAIVYISKFREYGILVFDGGSSFQEITYCPWCGKKLPGSLRNEWFEELERLGIDPIDGKVPKKYLSDQWWLRQHPENRGNSVF